MDKILRLGGLRYNSVYAIMGAMKKKQLNVTVSEVTIKQVQEIQGFTAESQAALIIRLVAQEYGRLTKSVIDPFVEEDVPKD